MKLFFSIWMLTCVFVNFSKAQSLPWYAINGQDVQAAISLNPAYLFNPDLNSSINVGSATIDYNNNFGYFLNKSFFDLIFNMGDVSVPELQFKKLGFDPAVGIDRDLVGYEMKLNETDLTNIYFSTSWKYTGPGFYKREESGFNWGVTSGIEVFGGVNNYPRQITYGPYRKYSSSDEIQVNKFNGFGDAIVKIGFNGAYEYKIDPKTRFSIGGTLRYIGSLAHFSMTSDAPIGSLYFLKRDEVQASNLKLIYQYSHNGPEEFKQIKIGGNGIGGDLGVFFNRQLNYPQVSFFRCGISLTDFGAIWYGKDMKSGEFNINTPTILSFGKFNKFEGFDQLIDSFDYHITKKPENSHKQKSGGVSYTPTNLQFTVGCGFMNYGRVHFYFSTPLVQWSPEAFQIGLVPELTFRMLNILVPFSYNQWTGFRLGTGINLSFLTIGTDDVRTFRSREQLKSGSFYVGINLNKFVKKVRKSRQQSSHAYHTEFMLGVM